MKNKTCLGYCFFLTFLKNVKNRALDQMFFKLKKIVFSANAFDE